MRSLVAGAALCIAGFAFSAPPAVKSPEQPKAELKELRNRIEALRKEVADNESSHSEAADALKDTEQTISETNRRLRELSDQKEDILGELNTISSQSQALESKIGDQQRQLERLVRQQYQNRGQDSALRHLLAGTSPNQAARDAFYLSHVSKARAAIMGDLKATLDEKQRLAEIKRTRGEQISTIEQTQKKAREDLLRQRENRAAVITRISDKIDHQRKEIATLQRDEARLTQVIVRLERMLAEQRERARKAEQARHAEAARKAAEDKRRAAETARKAKLARKRGQPAPVEEASPEPAERKKESPVARNEHEPESFAFSGSLNRLRGQLRLPVRGELLNRFGAPRAEGKTTWKGLFIRAAGGADVKSVAPGRVVFSEWMRGFGNLIILDHGDSYLSIYGYNESLLRRVGDTVRAGDPIASVGNSGGSGESGLYFELRHQGRAIDPLQWVSLR